MKFNKIWLIDSVTSAKYIPIRDTITEESNTSLIKTTQQNNIPSEAILYSKNLQDTSIPITDMSSIPIVKLNKAIKTFIIDAKMSGNIDNNISSIRNNILSSNSIYNVYKTEKNNYIIELK